MWTLEELRTKIRDRLAENSTNFWSDGDLLSYINEAQRLVSSLSESVYETLKGDVSTAKPYLKVEGKLVGEFIFSGYIDGGASLYAMNIGKADLIWPEWRMAKGAPKWVFIDPVLSRVFCVPAPKLPTSVTLEVAIISPDLVDDSDILFNDTSILEKFQGAVLNYAAGLALLKERYDGDAERFIQLAHQELHLLGLESTSLPTLKELSEDKSAGREEA